MSAEKLTRADLRKFDKESTKLLLEAQEKGARIRISNRGHALVYGPNGGSASVPSTLRLANRSAQNARAAVARLWK